MEAPESSNRATTPPYSLQVRARQGATKGEEVATAVGSCTVAISTCHLPVFSKRLPLSNGQGYAGLAEQQSSAFVGQLVPVIEISQMQSFPHSCSWNFRISRAVQAWCCRTILVMCSHFCTGGVPPR